MIWAGGKCGDTQQGKIDFSVLKFRHVKLHSSLTISTQPQHYALKSAQLSFWRGAKLLFKRIKAPIAELVILLVIWSI